MCLWFGPSVAVTLTTLTSSRHKWGGSRDSGGSSSRLRFDTVSRGPALIWYSSPRFSFSLFVFIKCVSYYCCCWRSWSNCNYCGYGVLHVVVVVCVARVVLFSLSHALLLNICPLRCTAAVLPCCSALLCDSSLWSEKCKANKQQQQQRASEAGCVCVCVLRLRLRLRLQRQRLFLFTCSLQSYLAVHAAVLELRASRCGGLHGEVRCAVGLLEMTMR